MKFRLYQLLFALIVLSFLQSCEKTYVVWNSVKTEKCDEQFRLKVFVENSGSMDGYMCDGSELKDAVYSYISALNSFADTTALFYINSEVIPYANNIKSFIKDLDPSSFRLAGGNRSNSDIADMFEKIIRATESNTVSIFISDCILDVPNGDAIDFFSQKKIELRNALWYGLNKNKNLSVQVLRLKSIFTGKHYYSNGFDLLQEEERPYFIWIIGDKEKVAAIQHKVPISEIEHGYENVFSWSTPAEIAFEISNEHGLVSNNLLLRTPSSNDKYKIRIKADLCETLQNDEILCNLENYTQKNVFLNIDGISKIVDENSRFTHIFDVSISTNYKSAKECLTFEAPILPTWLEEVNDNSGKNVKANINKTTGIKYLIEGVANAYKDKRDLFNIQFVINKN